MLAPISDVVIIVDVLSFSTAVEIATSRGAVVFPYRWEASAVHDFARSVGAEVADRYNPNNHSLSPTTLLNLPPDARLVLPSPNGATLTLLAGSRQVVLGCLRNYTAVARSAMRMGSKIAVIPAGERWEDGSLRPAIEDTLGAGAILKSLKGTLSPEASATVSVFDTACVDMLELLRCCGSGKEKIERGEENDICLAADLNVSECVPILTNGFFVKEVV